MSQLKIKNGNNWESIPAGGIGVPSGGNAGDVLVKSSSADYATGWATAPQGKLYVFEIKTSQSIGANSMVVVSTNAVKSGYKAIGVVGFYVNGLGRGTVRSCFLQDNNEDGVSTQPAGYVVWEIFNANTSAQTAICRAHVLYEKT